MRIAVYLPLLLPLLATWGAAPMAERLPPRIAAWSLTVAGVVFACCSSAALAMLAATAALRVPLLADLERYSLAVVSRDDPASPPVALVAGVLLGVAAVALARTAARRARAVLATHRHTRALPGDEQLVVLPDPAAHAYAAPGRPGRVVVSTTMLRALGPAEQDALIAHERAHLDRRHHLFLAAVHLAAAVNPLLRRLARAVGYALERWADEDAARHVGSRSVVARSVGRAALASAHSPVSGTRPALGLGIAPTLPRDAGEVPRRVAALLAMPVYSSRWLFAAATVVLLAAMATLEAQQDFETLLELARHAVTG